MTIRVVNRAAGNSLKQVLLVALGNCQVKVLHKKNYVLPLSLAINNDNEDENEDENLKQLSSFIFQLNKEL